MFRAALHACVFATNGQERLATQNRALTFAAGTIPTNSPDMRGVAKMLAAKNVAAMAYAPIPARILES